MDVRCDRCQTEYELDDASVSDTGTSVQCTTCGHQFIVTRRPSAPAHPAAITPPGGQAKLPGTEPEVPPWALSTDDGKVHRFRDLNTLQKWIVERKVSRTDRLSHQGGPWLALGEMEELSAFFRVVDEADRARGHGQQAAHDPFAKPPARRGTSSAPYGTTARAPAGASGTPPPVPFDARKPVQPDGPTVPNRRLPDMSASGAEIASDAVTPTRLPRRTPPLGLPPAGEGRASGAVNPNTAQTMRAIPAVAGVPRTASASASGPHAGVPGAAPNSPSRPNQLPLDRPHGLNEFGFADETGASDMELLMPRHRARNATIAVVLLGGLAAGGFYAWHAQASHSEIARAPATAAPPEPSAPATAAGPAAAPPPAAPAVAAAPAAPAPAEPAPAPPDTAAAAVAPPPRDAPEPRERQEAKQAKQTKQAKDAGKPSHGKGTAASSRATNGQVAANAAAVEPGGYDHLVTEADRLLENGQAAKAEKMYTQALQAKPDGAGALTGLAYVQLERQRYNKAIDMFRRVLNTQPTYGPALFGIADSYRGRGDNEQALSAYKQYLSISPSGADAPAARRQIKELESATAQAAQAPSGSTKKDQEDE